MKIKIILLLLCFPMLLQALDRSGMYSYSKGTNKACGWLYLTQVNNDSVFFILQAISGSPEFLTSGIHGFIRLEGNAGEARLSDSVSVIHFLFTSTSCTITENEACHFEFCTNGTYRKNNTQIRKGSNYLPAFSERYGVLNTDTASWFTAPHTDAKRRGFISKDESISIHDACNGYYLIETKKVKHEFAWVPRRFIQVKKAP
jgi:hypothetical protein